MPRVEHPISNSVPAVERLGYLTPVVVEDKHRGTNSPTFLSERCPILSDSLCGGITHFLALPVILW